MTRRQVQERMMRSRVGLLVVLVSMLTVGLSAGQAAADPAPDVTFDAISGPTAIGSTVEGVTATFAPWVNAAKAHFTLYRGTTCASAAFVTDTTASIDNTTHVASFDLVLSQLGTNWLTVSAGNTAPDYNDKLAEDCGNALPINVTKAQPSVAVTVSRTAVPHLGGLSATATLTGAFQPSKDITFDLMDATCTTSVSGPGKAEVVGGKAVWDVTPPAAGTYRVRATYPGDSTNLSATGCNSAPIVVSPKDPEPLAPSGPAAATPTVTLASALVDGKGRMLLALPRKGLVHFLLSATNPGTEPVERTIGLKFSGFAPNPKKLPAGVSTSDHGKTYTWRGTVQPGASTLLDMAFKTRRRAGVVVSSSPDTTIKNVGPLAMETGDVRLVQPKVRAFVPAQTPQIIISGRVSSATCTGPYRLQVQLKKHLQVAKWTTQSDVSVTVAPVDGRCTLRAVFAIGRKGVRILNAYRRLEFRIIGKGVHSPAIVYGIKRR